MPRKPPHLTEAQGEALAAEIAEQVGRVYWQGKLAMLPTEAADLHALSAAVKAAGAAEGQTRLPLIRQHLRHFLERQGIRCDWPD